jgi:RNA polymerase sigma factor (sigma-70 family)
MEAVEATVKRQAVADFFKAERARLVGYVRSLIDDAAGRDGEDVVQDVIVSVLERLDVTAPIEDLSAYVYQALRNRVVDHFRKRRPTASLDAPVGDDPELSLGSLLSDPAADAFDTVYGAELRLRILSAIELLSDDEKAVVIETEFNETTFKELAERWGVPIGTLLSRKSRALAKIAQALADLAEELEVYDVYDE